MSGNVLPPIPPITPGELKLDHLDVEDAEASALMSMRGRWILAALNASLEQMTAEVGHHRLIVDTNSIEVKVHLCGAAAGAVTAAQLIATAQCNALVRSMQPVFDDIAVRLKAIEARESELIKLSQKMQAMLDALGGVPTREEFQSIMASVDAPRTVCRKAVPLAPGEEAPTIGFGQVSIPPEGMRWETDAELRERIQREVPRAEE